LNFSNNHDELNFVISNGGGGGLAITSINEDSTDWLNISPVAIDQSGLGIYSATLDRAMLPGDVSIITASITIESNVGSVELPVLVLKDNPNYRPDAGVHYVKLIDADSGQTINEIQSLASNGQYGFTMENVPFGNYIVVAGSNPDNNGLICDVAESCGEYPSAGLVEEITINEFSPAITNVNFETNFNQIAITQGRGKHYLP